MSMRVVVTLPNWSLNGVSTFSVRLVRQLRLEGVDATLLLTGSPWRDGKPLPAIADLSPERLHLPVIATWEARWRALREHLEARAPCLYLPNHDVLHSVVVPRLTPRVGVVPIAHSDDPQHYDHVRRLAPWTDVVVGVSARVVERMRAIPELADARIAHIPYGVEAASRAEVERARGGAVGEDAPLRILYAGRLEERQKRVSDLLPIARMLRARRVPFVLTIVGDGPARRTLEEGVRKDALRSQVRLIGTVAPGDMRRQYRAHDAFLLPSAFEGLPLALLEAMGEGCVPVVSAIESGIPELVEHDANGLTVAVGDVGGFADALARLSVDRVTLARLAMRAHATLEGGGYDVATMTRRYLALFARVAAGEPPSRAVRAKTAPLLPPGWGWRMRLRAPLAGWRDSLVGDR